MALETYNQKRNFKVSPEPQGKVSGGRKAKASGNSFVIQKHDATRLHYDFRLELDGVLKSWAVTRGPSFVPGEKRLAVHVEDHPLDYGGFEGMIPKGNYGAGAVLLWDRGTWDPIGDPHKGYKKGHMEFELKGEKLEGRWHLIRMARREGEKRENWLLVKGEDEFARAEGDKDILDEMPLSVKSGKTLDEIWGRKAPTGRSAGKPKAKTKSDPGREKSDIAASKIKGARKAELPDFVEPQLATLVKSAPSGKRWVHEIKLDGYRLQARIENGKVKLLTRTGLDWTHKFGDEIIAEFGKLSPADAIIDGEVAVEAGSGATDFSLLQQDLSEGRDDRFTFYAFDLLHLDGYDLTGATLLKRKEALETLLTGSGPALRFSEHFSDEGGLVLKHACRLSLEGIISKISDAPYRPGRGRDWVKSKCSARQEFVIAGFVPSSVSRTAIGSLVMGYYDKGKLRHAGRVGTGYSNAMAQSLFKRLQEIQTGESPFDEKLAGVEKKDVVFVRPELVAEVEFRGWTADAHIRHAAFRGLREDKDPKDIVREGGPVNAAEQPKPPKRTVNLTHPDRVYWPDAGVTKAGLADYYTEVWRLMAPFVVNRPLALVRGPDGIGKPLFFQKHGWKGMTKNAVLVKDPTDPAEEDITIRDLDGLLGLVQGATLEIHPWGSTLDDWEKPDMVNIDLDPGEGVSWTDIIAAAHEVKRRFEDMGLVAFVKTSGGKGLHVVAPVKPKAEWPEVKAAMKALADGMAGDDPDKYVSTITKSKRSGKILIDYLRNGRGNTAVAPYSTRARPGAPVSMPVEWDELGGAIGPNYFTAINAPARIAQQTSDPWGDFRKAEAPIEFKAKKKR
ncbi:DNA ligase D [Neorhizobium galegae bv. officinalis bv. officinalis str. HAMBI 1141]|uniref:DNA ligase (ATP) n=1 Tax=Neorhizobium galegae bv. officinalis bv. officinalis str. HAMBI 1141 TaxID=1028801 RepID=A0A068TDW9_NEOGA|nr:DNA ligase D [Neorhizobium galegae]CDN55560.1 DNA ligase D [Neorhizobium galegae bv. officinalis bv. officinalis str. HAMBI 1141]